MGTVPVRDVEALVKKEGYTRFKESTSSKFLHKQKQLLNALKEAIRRAKGGWSGRRVKRWAEGHVLLLYSSRTLIQMTNNSGPCTDPCGISLVTWLRSE